MIRYLLEKIALRLKIRPIYHEGGLYLKRYYVCTLFNYWRIYLHHFMLDDPDGLHNHPWKYGISLILAGSYYDKRRWGYKKVNWINIVNGDTLHKVCLINKPIGHYISADDWSIEPQTVWSLFIHGPRRCDWAFVRPLENSMDYQREASYQKVIGTDSPTPLSDWHKDALTGAEWEAQQKQ